MRRVSFAAVLSLVAGTVVLSPSVASAQQAGAQPAKAAGKSAASKAPSIERFLKIRSAGSVQFAPDGSIYVRDWPDGVNQLYRIPASDVAKPGPEGKPPALPSSAKRLTNYKDGASGYSLAPDGSRALIAYASGGNENTQIAVLDPKTDVITNVLENPKVQYALNAWSKDCTSFYYSGNDTSPNDFHLYRYDFGAGKPTKILGREGSWSVQGVTDDNSRVLVARFISAAQQENYELTPGAAGAEPKLTDISIKNEKGELAATDIVGYMPGEKAVVVTSDVEKGIRRLFVRSLADGKLTKPLAKLDQFEIDGASMNPERTLLALVTNEDGYGVLRLYRLPDFTEVDLPPIEKGVVSLSSLRGNRIAWTQSNARTPNLTFAYEVPGAGQPVGKARQVTFAEEQGIDLSSFPLPELVKYSSFDGLEIPAFLWTPPGYKAGTPIPFVVNYHGGPEGQFRPTFSATIQFLLARGYGVMQPNVRGSTGYGRAFHMMDDYKNRWNSVKDGVEAAHWLVKNNYAKAGKIATYGGSYGGFMSVACIVEDGSAKDRVFGAGVNVVGIVNMKTFLEQTSGYRRKLREVEYGPLTDPEFLKSVSSIEKIDNIKVPMMIAHGLNDPRVPVGEAMQLAIGLKKRGFDPVEFYCPDEGHGFAKLENRLLFSERMAKFLDDTIGK